MACDSLGGIGPKPLDKVKVSGYTVGKFTTRVALMEVLSIGAKPFCVVDNLSVEPVPTGEDILRGVREESVEAGLDPVLAVTGSAEKNLVVEQTGVGITVVGIAKKEALRIGVSRSRDAVVAIGNACVGDEVLQAELKGKICNISDILRLLSLDGVHEILPVGSEGIKREINTMTFSSGLAFQALSGSNLDVTRSAGPATVIIASISPSKLALIEKLFLGKPFELIGELC